MDPKSLGPLFGYLYTYADTVEPPLVLWSGTTREIDPPFRYGRSWIFRLPRSRRALVVGVWLGRLDEEEQAIEYALAGRDLGHNAEEIREWD